jgi:hypothetical protein
LPIKEMLAALAAVIKGRINRSPQGAGSGAPI